MSARAIASHALSIFGDHSDVYACRQTGVAMLCESSVPGGHGFNTCGAYGGDPWKNAVYNFFDGFRTSHEIQKIETWEYEDLKELMDMEAVENFRKQSLSPEHPCEMEAAQNPDIFFSDQGGVQHRLQ